MFNTISIMVSTRNEVCNKQKPYAWNCCKYIETLSHMHATVDWENFIIKKVTWDKNSMRFNFAKAESIVCTSTEELHC